jgi:hypothetical protein
MTYIIILYIVIGVWFFLIGFISALEEGADPNLSKAARSGLLTLIFWPGILILTMVFAIFKPRVKK